jgi:ABC-2 type transport system permease protein
MMELKRAYYIARKDLKAYYFKPPLVSWGLMLPFVFILAFYLRNPQGIADLSPGLVGLTLLFSSTSMAAIVISFEKRIDALERLLMAPIHLRTILLGKGLAAAAFGFGTGVFTLVVVFFLFSLHAYHLFSLLIALLLSCFAFALVGILISVGVREIFEAMTLSNFFRLPMVFLCGVFFPVTSMPWILQIVGFALPLTYSVDALRQSLLGHGGFLPHWVDILILLGFCIVLFEIATVIFRKRTQEM